MRFAILLAPVLLVACGPVATAPSLLPRPIERTLAGEPAVAATAAAAADPALDARASAALDRARAGRVSFDRVRAAGRDALAAGRGSAPGGEAWIAAQTARSAVEAARRPIVEALAELDALRIEALNRAVDDRAIALAQAEVQRIADDTADD